MENTTLITEVPKGAGVRTSFNGKLFGKYDMIIDVEADRVGCALCSKEIKEDIYYCEDDNIFMHKSCLIKHHKKVKNITLMDVIKNERSEHEDKSVDVRFKS